jgi:hypothetical protein
MSRPLVLVDGGLDATDAVLAVVQVDQQILGNLDVAVADPVTAVREAVRWSPR